jgi:tripartite-type tricarboxylate transporter receptor subunit TctC
MNYASIARPAILLSLAHAVAAPAADFPTRPIRMLVGFPAGGSTDVLARQIGQQLTLSMKHQIVIDNRPGAAGNVASEVTAKANPDGYTLMMATVASHGINPSLYRKIPYDAIRDFSPVTLVASYPLVLAVNPNVPAKSVRELIDLARAKPGEVRFASSGSGSPGHLAGELFKLMAKVDVAHVPYKGGAPANIAVLSGECQFTFATLPAMMPFIKAGRLVAPAVTTAKRSPALPNVPTIAEAGLAGYDVSSWAGVVAPAGTPRPVINKLHTEVVAVLRNPTIRERLAAEGAEPVGNSPAEFSAFIAAELKKWAGAVKQAGAQVD